MNLIYPRWQFPNNLGDSMVFCSLPKLLKRLNPNEEVNVLTDHSLKTLLDASKDVDNVYTIATDINFDSAWWQIMPVNHPKLFSTIKDRWEEFQAHDSINFITLNYLIQMNLVDEGFSETGWGVIDTDIKRSNSKSKIAICPMTKSNGKPTPHPNCDGVGYRFNGPSGEISWAELLNCLKSSKAFDSYEFSPCSLGLGDYHIGIQPNMLELYKQAMRMDYAITTDGGYHHLFNLCGTPITLFTGTKVTKPEFMALGNAYIPNVHLECRKTCSSFYSEVFGVEDKSVTCNLECENLSPFLLAEKCKENIDEIFSNRS
jgi:hypothetical protein